MGSFSHGARQAAPLANCLSTEKRRAGPSPVMVIGAAKANTPRPMAMDTTALKGESAGSVKLDSGGVSASFASLSFASFASFLGCGEARLTDTMIEKQPHRM